MEREKKVYLLAPPTGTNRTPEENLGLEYLAAESRANGHTVIYEDAWMKDRSTDETVTDILKHDPEVLGISPTMDSIKTVLEIAAKLRRRGFGGQIINGGIYASFEAGNLLLASNGTIDGVLTGEADDSFQEYLRTGNLRGLPGAVYTVDGNVIQEPKQNVPDDLDRLPRPIRETLPLVRENHTPSHVLGSRGCYGNCSFCSVACFQQFSTDKRWRGRSPESIVAEILSLHDQGEDMAKIIDDNFFGGRDKSRELEFTRLMIEAKVAFRFRMSLRVNDVQPELIREFKKAGLFAVSLGVESFVKRKLHDYAKGTSVEQNLKALRILEENGIYVQMGHIMFDPFITIPEIEEELFYLGQTKWAVTKGICTQLFAAEGTRITERIRNEIGFIGKSGTNNLYRIRDDNARAFYEGIKPWAKHNSNLYDMVIDPISAPKNVPAEVHAKIHALCVELKELDLAVAASILADAKKGQVDQDHVSALIRLYQPKLNLIRVRTQTLYDIYGLNHQAGNNKHIY